jgi:hypothetical protein
VGSGIPCGEDFPHEDNSRPEKPIFGLMSLLNRRGVFNQKQGMDYLSYDYEITMAVLSPTLRVHAPSKKRSPQP